MLDCQEVIPEDQLVGRMVELQGSQPLLVTLRPALLSALPQDPPAQQHLAQTVLCSKKVLLRILTATTQISDGFFAHRRRMNFGQRHCLSRRSNVVQMLEPELGKLRMMVVTPMQFPVSGRSNCGAIPSVSSMLSGTGP